MSNGADPVAANAAVLDAELAWFSAVLQVRIALHFGQPCDYQDIHALPPPDIQSSHTAYAVLVQAAQLGPDERLVLALALTPHLRPEALDILQVRNTNTERGFAEFGGWKGRQHGGFLPTGETAVFLLAGDHLARRFAAARLFAEDHVFRRRNILRLEGDAAGEPALSAALAISSETLQRITSGMVGAPEHGPGFPAKRITTPLSWADLVLDPLVLDEIDSIKTWARCADTFLSDWRLAKALKPGYRSLFYGPPGTGKTLTATLIGKEAGLDVYRIDLSMVVSKYIGETEKNLAQVFEQAERRGWILFFDEADALFGKRTSTSSANDRYANQEVAYLLQRVEDYAGIVILATNLKANIDEAFARRFQSLIWFPMPDATQRQRLWEGMLSDTGRLAEDVDLARLALDHELAGGAITNVVRYGAINAMQAGRDRISHADLLAGIGKELRKEGRTLFT